MRQLFRILGVAVLAAALLDASAGLCFCHRGPGAPESAPASHGCCHGPDAAGPIAVKAAVSCCHVEAAERQATPAAAVHVLPPVEMAALPSVASVAAALPSIARALPATSPPLFTLRI
jgi:hypothetical protein